MEEYHSLGVTRSCEILVDRCSYIRGKGTDTSDLQETKEILKHKLQITDTAKKMKFNFYIIMAANFFLLIL